MKVTLVIPVLLLSALLPRVRAEARFTNLDQSKGLRSSDVMCFQQDRQGFIWIGTKLGLNVYDGSDFDVYNFSHTAPFSSDISALQLGKGDEMWIGTTGEGLYRYGIPGRSLEHIALVVEEDTARSVNALCLWDGQLWAGTELGLFRIGPGESPLLFEEGRTGIIEMKVHHDRLAVSVQDKGLFLVHHTGVVSWLDFPEGQVNAILSMDEQHLLLGTQYAGLYCISTSDSTRPVRFYNESLPEPPPVINAIMRDHQGTIWVGTDGEGLYAFSSHEKGGEATQYRFNSRKSSSIASNAIFSLFEDAEENLWIGTIWKGLSILDPSASGTELIYSDISGNDTYPVLSLFSQGNELWMGTDGKGISLIRDGNRLIRRYHVESSPALSGNYVQHISRDSRGCYWIGTFSSGLNCLDPATGRISSHIHRREDSLSISYNDVRKVLEDQSGNLWVATWGGGLNFFDREKDHFRSYAAGSQFNDPSVTADITSMCWSADRSSLWVGTFGHGLFRFDIATETFTQIQAKDLERLKVLSLELDEEGYLWMGTWGNGLVVYNSREGVRVFRESLGQLDHLRVTAVEKDRFGKIWFSSKNGIWSFNPADSILRRPGVPGLLSNKEFHINASCQDEEGNLYFGGIAGVVRIAPDHREPRKVLPPPLITNIYLFNNDRPGFHPGEWQEEMPLLKLDYNQNFITLSFATPSFPVSDVTYSYMLEGFNDVWVAAQDNRATFQGLPPGKYVFKVHASLHELEWSETTELELRIAQPYWKTWYAFLVYVSLFTLFLYLFYKYTVDLESVRSNLKLESLRREKEHEMNAIKQRFFTNISHEIRTPVTLILGSTNRLIENGSVNRENQKEITVLKNSSRHLLNLINELLDFGRLESGGIKIQVAEGDFQKFSREVYLSFQSQAYENQVDYRFVSREEETRLWFDRDQMEKVLYNLISNAFKYTPPGGIITVEVDRDDQFVYLSVSDSGTGIPEDKLKKIFKRFYQSDNAMDVREQGFGIGLSISRDIVKMHGGEIYARNNPEGGLTISAKFPCGSVHLSEELRIRDFHNSEYLESYKTDKLTISTNLEDKELSGEHILIVDDNPQLLEYLEGLFAGLMKVLTASNGEEGLQMANKHIPDIIVSDIMMPVMDGVSMTKILKTSMLTSHIPVILLTARTNLIFKKEGYDIGADEYITKPFNEVLLKTRVINILRNRRQFREKLAKDFLSKPRESLNIRTPDQEFLARLTAVIEQNIEEKEISASLIASEMGMSHSVIYKKIKGLTGMSLIEFIRDFKLKRAASLLSRYQLNISEVCYRVGFSDRRYFSRLFKGKYGVTPSEYARSN